jgi:hypothetical protein
MLNENFGWSPKPTKYPIQKMHMLFFHYYDLAMATTPTTWINVNQNTLLMLHY